MFLSTFDEPVATVSSPFELTVGSSRQEEPTVKKALTVATRASGSLQVVSERPAIQTRPSETTMYDHTYGLPTDRQMAAGGGGQFPSKP